MRKNERWRDTLFVFLNLSVSIKANPFTSVEVYHSAAPIKSGVPHSQSLLLPLPLFRIDHFSSVEVETNPGVCALRLPMHALRK